MIFISAAELVGPKYRVAVSATLSSIFALGEVILGTIAWLVQPWRYMLIALHVPGFLVILYCGVLSESVRWLLSKKKYDEARKILENVARINKTRISNKSIEALINMPQQPILEKVLVKLVQYKILGNQKYVENFKYKLYRFRRENLTCSVR